MTKKMGRPLKGSEKRDKRFEIRISNSELTLLNETAERLNMTKADTVITAIKELSEKR